MKIQSKYLFIILVAVMSSLQAAAIPSVSEYFSDTLKWIDGTTERSAHYQQVATDTDLAVSYFENAQKIDLRIAGKMDHKVLAALLNSVLTKKGVEYLHEHFETLEATLLKQKEQQLLQQCTDNEIEKFSRFLAYYFVDLTASFIGAAKASQAAVSSVSVCYARWKAVGANRFSSDGFAAEEGDKKAVMIASGGGTWSKAGSEAFSTISDFLDSDEKSRRAVKSAYQAAFKAVFSPSRRASKAAAKIASKTAAQTAVQTVTENSIESFGYRKLVDVGTVTYSLAALSALNWTLGKEAEGLRKKAEKLAFKKLVKLATVEEVSIVLTKIENRLWHNPSRTWRGTLFNKWPHFQIMEVLFSPQPFLENMDD